MRSQTQIHDNVAAPSPPNQPTGFFLGYQKDALRLPSDSLQSKLAMAKYNSIFQNAFHKSFKEVVINLPEKPKLHRLSCTKSQLQDSKFSLASSSQQLLSGFIHNEGILEVSWFSFRKMCEAILLTI